MKIAIIGYSGSGKSTLAQKLSTRREIPLLHLDKVHWLPGWQERERAEECAIVGKFLDENEAWVIDGNYGALHYARRMEEADQILFLCFNRFSCLSRAMRRHRIHKGTSRDSMTEGCPEKIDLPFIWWILHRGRTRRLKKRYQNVLDTYGDKVIRIRNQHELDRFEKEFL